MTTLAIDAKARAVTVSDDKLTLELDDGRSIAVPLVWYSRLVHATSTELARWRLIGGGEGIQWPDLDEDVGIEGLLAGRASAESKASLEKWLAKRGG
jgi:hypothetical protein